MSSSLATLVARSIKPADVVVDGRYTIPRSYGVYQLPYGSSSPTRFHYGNHPVRNQELERDFGSCTLTFLFESKDDAEAVAAVLNGREV